MAKEIRWTKEAEETFDSVVSYLQAKWTDKEVRILLMQPQRLFFIFLRTLFYFAHQKNIESVRHWLQNITFLSTQ